jgi:hypothetical protein
MGKEASHLIDVRRWDINGSTARGINIRKRITPLFPP